MTTIEVDTFQELLLTELPRLLKRRPAFRYKVQDSVLETVPSREDFQQLLQEIKDLREDGNRRFEASERRFEEQVAETRAMREEGNRRFEASERRFEAVDRRFEEQIAEMRAMREDSNHRFEEQAAETQAMREDSNHRFEEQTAEMRAMREDSNHRFGELIAEMRAMREDSNRRFEASDRRMDEGFKDVQKSIDRLGQRWGIRNESIFRQTIAALLEESYGANVESRWIDGEQYDVIIANGDHILVEITASAGPKIQKTLERKQRSYTETVRAPARVILAAASIHSRRARALEEAGFEVIEPEEIDV